MVDLFPIRNRRRISSEHVSASIGRRMAVLCFVTKSRCQWTRFHSGHHDLHSGWFSGDPSQQGMGRFRHGLDSFRVSGHRNMASESKMSWVGDTVRIIGMPGPGRPFPDGSNDKFRAIPLGLVKNIV